MFSLDLLHQFNQKVNNQPELFERELVSLFSQPAMMEAIYIASPELYDSFVGFLEGRVKTGVDKLLKTLYKYLIRMTSRSTPYGLFAGCAEGEFGSKTRISFDHENPFYTHARLDMNYVAEMASDLLKREEIRQQLLFYVNSSLYRVGDAFRYVESFLKNKKRHYLLSAVETNKYLELILAMAASGATISQMTQALQIDDISEEEASKYIDSLIEAQLLLSELEPTVTGDEFFTIIIQKLQGLEQTEEIVFQLNRISAALKTQQGGVKNYKAIEEIIGQHFSTTSSKDLIQTDLFFNTKSCVISDQAIETVKNELQQIYYLGGTRVTNDFGQFKQKFYERYEEREMPLLAVLDNENGIGYGKLTAGKADNLPLLDDIFLPSELKNGSTEWSVLNKFRERIYAAAMKDGDMLINLTDEMINKLKNDLPALNPVPESFYLFGSFIANSAEDMDRGNFKFAHQAMGGPSGLKLIGRFCHGNQELTKKVIKATKEEEGLEPDSIFAEIAHLPEARVGNVLMRPHFRDYEIVYLAASSLPKENQIPVDDLMVSVKGGKEIILRSKRLNKRIHPRLTNAHNFATGLPVYRFLCDLTNQTNYQFFSWSWDYLSMKPFLPRVQYKHWILSKASWNIDLQTVPALMQPGAALVHEWSLIRQQFNIPRFVQIVQGSNDLLIDGDSEFSVQILCDSLRKFSKIVLSEFLEEPNGSLVKSEGNKFTHEVLIPMLNVEKTNIEIPVSAPLKTGNVKRNFIVGSEWLYVKIYAGTKTSDKLLTTVIKPFTEKLLAEGEIEKWFFIRYADPEEHIRLRFYNASKPGFWNHVLAQLTALVQPLIDDGVIQKIQIDTYKRELERYGHKSFENIETVFFADSVAVVSFLDLLGGDEGERYRWLVALRGVDTLLNDLGLSLERKKMLLDNLRESFFREFNGNTQLTVQLNDKYRLHTREIGSFMDCRNDEANEIQEVTALFEVRSSQIRQALELLPGGLDIPLENFSASIVHMFLNRLFVSKQRVHELVIYHYLKKYYESMLARTQKEPKKSAAVKE